MMRTPFFIAMGMMPALCLLCAADVDVRNAAEFKKLVPEDAKVERLATGMVFVEGPVWLVAPAGYLVFSDVGGNELKKWTPAEGLTTFRKPSHNANGNALDRQGRLVTCEHSARCIRVLEKDGTLRTLVDQFEGKKFNSPNDVVVKSDGTVWFTDPPYGLRPGTTKELDGHYVFRFDPKANACSAVVKDFDMPNGLCFSPDERQLYVADSGKPHHIRVFDVQRDGTLANGRVFCVIDPGIPDGIRCDTGGRIWSSAGDGVHLLDAAGKLIGKILVPETPANLCFGGEDGRTLFITGRTSLYSIRLAADMTK